MKLLIPDLTDTGLDVEFEAPLELDGVKLRTPVKASLRISRISAELLINGSFTGSVELQCSRCLKSFAKDLTGSIEVVYHPIQELTEEGKHEVKDEELDMDFYKDDELDIQELIKEQVILSIPMKPLCSETCKGICSQCGTDLNAGACRCAKEYIDPRFLVLKNYTVTERSKNGKSNA